MPIPASSGGRALPLLALTALVLLPLGQVVVVAGPTGAAIAIVVVLAGSRNGSWPAVRVATMGLLLAVFGLVGLPFALWPVVGVLWLASRGWPQLRPEPGWFPQGHASVASRVLAAATVLGAAAALTAWILSEPELGATTVHVVEVARRTPTAWILVFATAFVVINPIVEEVAYRNVVHEAACAGAPVAAAVVLQAIAFGTLHVVGFPAGSVGVALSFVYGLMLGIIRVLTGGLRVATIAHMATNATIAALVGLLVLPE